MNTEKEPTHSLKCSTCKHFLNIPPIMTSEDGKTNKCGRCRLKGPALLNRNSLYESIGMKLNFPCIYEGCDQRLAWHQVPKHEKSCPFRNIFCPFWVCRGKNTTINLNGDIGHLEQHHPRAVCSEELTLTLLTIIKLQSFIKILKVGTRAFVVFVHASGNGEQLWIGVFSSSEKPFDYHLKLYNPKDTKKAISYDANVLLYDDAQNCLYCLQKLCDNETHIYSKKHDKVSEKDDELEIEKYKYYTQVDILCSMNVLVSDNISFDIRVSPRADK